MKSLIRLQDIQKEDIWSIFELADEIQQGKHRNALKDKSVIMFFPPSSIRTRVTFEKAIYLLGGQSILFEPQTLEKKEEIEDVVGYLNNWADMLVIRYPHITLLDKICANSSMPIINAMTDVNHPCEMLADLYALHKLGRDIVNEKYLFVGAAGNIGYAWKEASEWLGFSLEQCTTQENRLEGIKWHGTLEEAAAGKDIICTDSIPKEELHQYKNIQVTIDIMKRANNNALLNPCSPFYRGEELSHDVINSNYFVGYDFKKYLLEIQMAIIIFLMEF